MTYSNGSEMIASFDVQVDGNHRWDEDRVCEIDVYRQGLNADGFYETDTSESLVHVEVPTGDYSDDMWFSNVDMDTLRSMPKPLPENILTAFEQAVAEATAKQAKTVTATHKWAVGDVVWVPEYIMPATVRDLTVNGGYVVDMGDSGELDEFPESALEEFDRERYENS